MCGEETSSKRGRTFERSELIDGLETSRLEDVVGAERDAEERAIRKHADEVLVLGTTTQDSVDQVLVLCTTTQDSDDEVLVLGTTTQDSVDKVLVLGTTTQDSVDEVLVLGAT